MGRTSPMPSKAKRAVPRQSGYVSKPSRVYRVQGLGAEGLGFRVQGLGFRIQGFGFRV